MKKAGRVMAHQFRISNSLVGASLLLLTLALAPWSASAKTKLSEYERSCQKLSVNKGMSANEKLKRVFELQWKYWMQTYPEWATYVGESGQNHRWTDQSLEAIAVRDREAYCQLKMIKSVNRSRLSQTEKTSYDLFLRSAEMQISSQKFAGELLVVDQMGGVHVNIGQTLEAMPRAKESDYRDILSRLRGVKVLLGQNQKLLEEGLKQKVTPPRITLRRVPQQVRDLIQDDALKSVYLKAFQDMPLDFSNELKSQLQKEAVLIYEQEIKAALKGFHDFLNDQYIPAARESTAWSDLPQGADWYQHLLREHTTTEMTAKEIHDLGMGEVRRIREQMQALLSSAGFRGSIADYKKFLQRDRGQFYRSPDELLAGYRDIAKRADPELAKLFGRLPRLPYGVKSIPDHEAKAAPTAYYMGGSLESGRPGWFAANTYDLSARGKWEMEALTLHEAVPGHHLQIALAQEMTSLPEFRRHYSTTAYVEGWALYAESLGEQMGFYKTTESKFGQLTYELWRAVRLVVDTGLHAMGWSRDQALKYANEVLPKAESEIIVEIDRYIVWAGQATAYKIGELKIKELRERARARLGERFDIREFHDLILVEGAVPLSVLEGQVEEYIQTKSNPKKAPKPQPVRRTGA